MTKFIRVTDCTRPAEVPGKATDQVQSAGRCNTIRHHSIALFKAYALLTGSCFSMIKLSEAP